MRLFMCQNKIKFYLFLLIPCLIASCSKRIKIDTYCDPVSLQKGFEQGSSFFIFTNNKSESSFLDKEITKKIQRILYDKGYKTATKEVASYYLFFTYDTKAEKYTIRVPQVLATTVLSNLFCLNGQSFSGGKTWNSKNINLNSSDTLVATQTEYVSKDVFTYNKTLSIIVYDGELFRKSSEDKQVWQSISYTYDDSSDYRAAFDYLLIASMRFFGKSSQKILDVSIYRADPQIKLLRNSYLLNEEEIEALRKRPDRQFVKSVFLKAKNKFLSYLR